MVAACLVWRFVTREFCFHVEEVTLASCFRVDTVTIEEGLVLATLSFEVKGFGELRHVVRSNRLLQTSP